MVSPVVGAADPDPETTKPPPAVAGGGFEDELPSRFSCWGYFGSLRAHAGADDAEVVARAASVEATRIMALG
jgi:hypothetical protein